MTEIFLLSGFKPAQSNYRICSATVVLPIHKEQTRGRGSFLPLLIFLWLLSFHQGKESDKLAFCKDFQSLAVVFTIALQAAIV